VNCLNDKEIKMAQVLQQYYQNSDDNWKKSIANFASKNLSTDEMNSVEQELASKVSQLQAAINAGNTSVMRDTMKNISDENLHLWANFDTAMIKSHINKLRDIASQYNVSANLDDLDNSLNSLSTYTAPGYKYTQSDLEKVWSTLRDDSGELKNVSMNILEMRRTEMQNRKQNMMNRTQGRGMMNRTQGKGMFNRTGQQENNNGSGGQ